MAMVNECTGWWKSVISIAHDWQTLIAAAVALFAAWMTVRTIRLQIDQDRIRHSESQQSKAWAARARMPDALSTLCTYCEDCMGYLTGAEYLLDGPLGDPPVAPDDAINVIKASVEYVDPNVGEKLFDLITHYQIHNSRLSRSAGDNPLEIAERMYDTVFLRGLVDRLFEYARNETDAIPHGELTRDMMQNALRSCVGLTVFVDNESSFTRVSELIDSQHPEA